MIGLKIEEAVKYNEKLKKYVYKKGNKLRINFKNKEALIEYNKTILKVLFGLDVELHDKGLIPTPINRYLFIKSTFKTLENLNIKKPLVLEIGTGHSAIISLLIKKYYNAEIYATEVDEEFINLAKYNIKRNNLNIEIINSKGRVISGIDEIKDKKFDLIISYPPFYSDNSVASGRKFGGALAKNVELIGGGKFGETFSLKIIEEGINFLNKKGVISLMLPKKPEKRRALIIKKMKDVGLNVEIDEIKTGNRLRYVIKGFRC
ncbi:MAG: RlmF-related methyltransferase [Methanococci archaeon]|nr:RlmF-related methyltransferase [Methanococci archaeon]